MTQSYDITANNADPYWVCGGLQDAGSSCGPSQTRAGGIYTSDWFNTGGGDGFHTAMDPSDSRIVYSESQPDQQGGNIGRFNLETGQRQSIRPNKNNITNWDEYITPEMEKTAADRNWGTQPQNAGPLRFNWSTPYLHLAAQPADAVHRRESPADDDGSRADVPHHQPRSDDQRSAEDRAQVGRAHAG